MSFMRAHVLDGITSLFAVVVKDIGGVEHRLPAGSTSNPSIGLPARKWVASVTYHTRHRHRASECGRTFANVAIATKHGNLTGHHHVGGTADCHRPAIVTASRIYCRTSTGDTVRSRSIAGKGSLALLTDVQTVHAVVVFPQDTPFCICRAFLVNQPGLRPSAFDLCLNRDFLLPRRDKRSTSSASARAPSKDVKALAFATIVEDSGRAFGELEDLSRIVPSAPQRRPLIAKHGRAAFGVAERRGLVEK